MVVDGFAGMQQVCDKFALLQRLSAGNRNAAVGLTVEYLIR